MGCSSFPWDAGDPAHEDVAAAAAVSRSNIRTLIIMRQSGRESHVLGVAADQKTCRDDKLMVVLLVVSAVCCERVESNESPWRSTCGCQTPSEAASMEEEPPVVMGSPSSLLPGPQVNLGLTTITKYFSYSKLWRMLFFVNDAPFRIHIPDGGELQGVNLTHLDQHSSPWITGGTFGLLRIVVGQ